MTSRRLPATVAAGLAAGAVALAGCTDGGGSASRTAANDGADAPATWNPHVEPARFDTSAPAESTTVLPDQGAASAALTTVRDLFETAPVVAVAAPSDAAVVEAAVDRGAPVLHPATDPAELTAELQRLDTQTVLLPEPPPPAATSTSTQNSSPTSTPAPTSSGPTDRETLAAVQAADAEVVTDPANLPGTTAAAPLSGVVVLTDGADWSATAVASATAAGARVLELPDGDPRTDPDAIARLAEHPPSHVLALGDAFGDVDTVDTRVATAATGVQLPGGGQVVFPHRRVVALYGHPGTSALGVMGEQPVEEAIERAHRTAAEYAELSDVPVVPAFEIIATVASSEPGADGDWSSESTVEELRPWVDAAREAGMLVVLDLQPGTTDFLTQAKRYEELLVEPHVGLALDPEWRLQPGQRHLAQIGSVSVEEVNGVITWLADLTREHALPQKVLVLHQFRLSMIRDRELLDTSRDELAVTIHADGNGTPQEKFATWNALRTGAPDNVHWAWKNFYDEDRPTFTPAQTMNVEPAPVFVSYQ